jgi:hypothetical protein
VGTVKIPYYVTKTWMTKDGRKVVKGYWQPTKRMKRLGFQSVDCGIDGPNAHKLAGLWNEKWQWARRGLSLDLSEVAHVVKAYPAKSVGEAFERYRRSPEWGAKKARTREDWDRAWKYIEPIFGDCDPTTITFEDLSVWYRGDPKDNLKGLLQTVGIREAHRAMKIWRYMAGDGIFKVLQER